MVPVEVLEEATVRPALVASMIVEFFFSVSSNIAQLLSFVTYVGLQGQRELPRTEVGQDNGERICCEKFQRVQIKEIHSSSSPIRNRKLSISVHYPTLFFLPCVRSAP
jgi:hypothetical protein